MDSSGVEPAEKSVLSSVTTPVSTGLRAAGSPYPRAISTVAPNANSSSRSTRSSARVARNSRASQSNAAATLNEKRPAVFSLRSTLTEVTAR